MITYAVTLLTAAQARAKRDGLIDLLIDSVESGASVNFVWPMTSSKDFGRYFSASGIRNRSDIVTFLSVGSYRGLRSTSPQAPPCHFAIGSVCETWKTTADHGRLPVTFLSPVSSFFSVMGAHVVTFTPFSPRLTCRPSARQAW